MTAGCPGCLTLPTEAARSPDPLACPLVYLSQGRTVSGARASAALAQLMALAASADAAAAAAAAAAATTSTDWVWGSMRAEGNYVRELPRQSAANKGESCVVLGLG